MSQEEDEFVRSFCFYRLNDMIERYDAKTKLMGPAKRKLIMNKIEKLASKPLLTKQDVEIKTKDLAKNNSNTSDPKNVIKFDTVFAAKTGNIETVRKQQLVEKFYNSIKIFQDLENDLKPVSEKEFIDTYVGQKACDQESAIKVSPV